MSGQNVEERSPKHGPESFAAVIVTALTLMATATFAPSSWYLPILLATGFVGLALALTEERRQRLGMGVLAAFTAALVFRYLYWLFLWTVPGVIVSIFK